MAGKFHMRNLFRRKNKTMKRQHGNRNLTRKNNNAARNFVNQRLQYNLSGNEILAQASNNMKGRVRKHLVNMGMLNNNA